MRMRHLHQAPQNRDGFGDEGQDGLVDRLEFWRAHHHVRFVPVVTSNDEHRRDAAGYAHLGARAMGASAARSQLRPAQITRSISGSLRMASAEAASVAERKAVA